MPTEIANRHLSNRFGALNHFAFREFDPCLQLQIVRVWRIRTLFSLG